MSGFKRGFQSFANANKVASLWIDRLFLPDRLRLDGNKTFHLEVVPPHLAHGLRVYDLGGGSNPYLSPEQKAKFGLHVTGLDISAEELAASPEGAYDRKIVADLCTFEGAGDGDLIICQATLEHVPDTSGAIRAIAETLTPGGRALLFLPSRNAVFARLNLVLPEGLKRCLLFSLYPHKAEGHDGFKAFYDRATPAQIAALAQQNGLEVEERRLFWISSYFMIFTPAFLLWRLYQGLAYLIVQDQAAETFQFTLRKPCKSSKIFK